MYLIEILSEPAAKARVRQRIVKRCGKVATEILDQYVAAAEAALKATDIAGLKAAEKEFYGLIVGAAAQRTVRLALQNVADARALDARQNDLPRAARDVLTPAELKSARQRLGLSAEAFARVFGAHDGRTVRGWEHGLRNGLPTRIPRSVEILVRLALALAPVRQALGLYEPTES